MGRPMDSSEDDTDPFEAAREAEYLAELELEASVTDSWVAQSNSDEALDNSLQLLAMLQDNTAAVQLPSRADTAGHDPFLDEDDYDIRTDQQPAPTPAPTQLPRLPSGDKCLLRCGTTWAQPVRLLVPSGCGNSRTRPGSQSAQPTGG